MQYTVDDVFELIGQLGWSQRTYFFLLGILQIFVAPHMLLNVFTGRWLQRYSGFHTPHSHKELWVITQCTSLASGGGWLWIFSFLYVHIDLFLSFKSYFLYLEIFYCLTDGFIADLSWLVLFQGMLFLVF